MKFIEFDHNKCDECFKCLRVCPTKAIAFTNHSRHIIDELCIKCGLCQMHCATGALKIHLDLNSVQSAIHSGEKVVASLAPSFAGAFKLEEAGQMATALKRLGFTIVEETARGAEITSLEYEKYIKEGNSKNLITSCCPSSNYLIEHYFQAALPSVIPVVSPMIAHGKDLKMRYGNDTFVVFIGPCLAKKAEAVDLPGNIDAVITFKELSQWLAQEHIIPSHLEPTDFDTPVTQRGRAYPMGGSLWKGDLKSRINPKYKYLHIDGIEDCKSFLSAIVMGEISGYCAELNICSGSCINGPDMPDESPNFYKRMSMMNNHINTKCSMSTYAPCDVSQDDLMRTFIPKHNLFPPINDDQISEILIRMDKYSETDQLNCGACGYSSCYDKAIAISRGLSDINMCLDTLRKKAESLQSIIFENSPNAICILDGEFRIQEVNPSFNRLLNASKIRLKHWPIAALIEDPIFDEIKDSTHEHIGKKMYLESIERTFYANVVKIQNGKNYVGIFTDITEYENSREEFERVKSETLITCQEVIDKQMRIAQEIASLLGETTAETKMGLNKLKKLVITNNGDFSNGDFNDSGFRNSGSGGGD
ncbi:[Fe-Fe] hydrogenase large subunit C-terminal domain-containing protein [Fusibacter bizertensis]